MFSTLQKTASWYNPMSINDKTFNSINIVDGDKILFNFNWFLRFARSSNSTDLPITLESKLVRSTLSKDKLRYSGTKCNYTLNIDKSLLNYSLVNTEIDNYDYNDTRIETYQLDNIEAYFTIRTQLKPNKKQVAYSKLSDKIENETRLTIYEIKRSIEFYGKNKALFKSAGITVKQNEKIVYKDTCNQCGCNEFLCGHNKRD